MYYFVEIACVIAEMIISNLFFSSLFRKKVNNAWPIVVCYSCFGFIILSLSFVEEASVVRIFASIVGFFIIIILIHNTRVLSALFASLAFMTIYALTDVIVITGFSLFRIDYNELLQYGNVRTSFIIITHTVLLGIIVCISAFNRSKQGMISASTIISLFPIWLSSIVLCCILVIQAYTTGADFHPLYLVVILGLLYTNILIIYFVNRIREQDRIKHEATLREHHYALEKEYYDQFHAQQEQTRALWHDISKYMRAMQSLADESNTEKAKENLAQAQALIDEIKDVVDVNNRVVNVILNEYINIAKNNGIDVNLDVHIPPELFVTVSDLYVVLGNTFDNSINACLDLEESKRKISVKIRMHNDMLYYYIENPYDKDYLSKKRDGIHGYGLKNIEQCVQRYNGTVEASSNGEIFSVTITMNSI